MPAGMRITLDAEVREADDATLIGGKPHRVLRLSPAGQRAWHELRNGPIRSGAAGALARRLTDTGAAHPWPQPASAVNVTVLVPVRDRSDQLAKCLAAQGNAHPVVVVDDGSCDPGAIAGVAERHGAAHVRRTTNGGPAAARNSGLAQLTSDFVALLDSDCTPPRGWIEALAGHFADPLVAAVAPRVVPDDSANRYAAAYGTLDLGPDPARVVPGSAVGYVPTAALLVRRAALETIADSGAAFDPALRYGEDVDLVWRLHEVGWRIRYDPSVQVAHREPRTWPATLARRYRYGTSAAPLAARHPKAMRHLVLAPGPAATVAALLARRPALAAVAFAAHTARTRRRVRAVELPATGLVTATARGVAQTWLGFGRYASQFAAPLVLAGMAVRGERRWGRRAALASLLLAPACTPARAPLPPTTRLLGRLADDLAYGAGVWTGCLKNRTLRPLAPAITRPMQCAGTERPFP